MATAEYIFFTVPQLFKKWLEKKLRAKKSSDRGRIMILYNTARSSLVAVYLHCTYSPKTLHFKLGGSDATNDYTNNRKGTVRNGRMPEAVGELSVEDPTCGKNRPSHVNATHFASICLLLSTTLQLTNQI